MTLPDWVILFAFVFSYIYVNGKLTRAIPLITWDQICLLISTTKISFGKVFILVLYLHGAYTGKLKIGVPILIFVFFLTLKEVYGAYQHNLNLSSFINYMIIVLQLTLILNIIYNKDFFHVGKISVKDIIRFYILMNVIILGYELLYLLGYVKPILTKSVNQVLMGREGGLAAFNFGGGMLYRFKSLYVEPKIFASFTLVLQSYLLTKIQFDQRIRGNILTLVVLSFFILVTFSTSAILVSFVQYIIFFSYVFLYMGLRKKLYFLFAFIVIFITAITAVWYLDLSETVVELWNYRVYYRLFGHDTIVSDAFSGPFMPSEIIWLTELRERPLILFLGSSYSEFSFNSEITNARVYGVPNIGLIYWCVWIGFIGLLFIFYCLYSASANYTYTLYISIILLSFLTFEGLLFAIIIGIFSRGTWHAKKSHPFGK